MDHDQEEIYEEYNKKAIFIKGLFLGSYAILAQQMSGINFLNAIGFYYE